MSYFRPIQVGDAMNSREAEIQQRLATLHHQLEAFCYPTPAEAPAEYEIEELEAWTKSKEQIRDLEQELAEIRRSAILKAANIAKHQYRLET